MSTRRRSPGGVGRRDFVKLCMTAVAAAGHRVGWAMPEGATKTYERCQLVDVSGEPLRTDALVVGETYVFNYPYVATPCFLLDLGEAATPEGDFVTERGSHYVPSAGVGPTRSVVAFSAICAHKMTHPAKSVSFINYRHEKVRYFGKDQQGHEGSQVIFCCSERSVYDARDGARVLGGPAPQPLASIELEYDERDHGLYAVGTRGGEMFSQFFEKFTSRLQLEHGFAEVDRLVRERSEVLPLDEYCRNRILC